MSDIKLRVGGKYRMKNFPMEYEYVLIIAKESDFGIDGISYYNDKETGVAEYAGIIIYKNYKLTRLPDLLSWGEDGSWDGAFLNDTNTIVSEVV